MANYGIQLCWIYNLATTSLFSCLGWEKEVKKQREYRREAISAELQSAFTLRNVVNLFANSVRSPGMNVITINRLFFCCSKDQ